MNVLNIKEIVNNYYNKLGYSIENGPFCDGAFKKIKDLNTGLAICESDIELFLSLSKEDIKSIYIIGNAFGYSTLTLSTIFPNAIIDVIDAEIEGPDNTLGSEITRKISELNNLNINLFSGFSPHDIPKSTRLKEYNLIFIDGLHTRHQLEIDLNATYPLLSKNGIIVCHDVILADLMPAIDNFIFKNKNLSHRVYESTDYVNYPGTVIIKNKD